MEELPYPPEEDRPPGNRRFDPDETDGRALYRNIADALARAEIAMDRHRVRLLPS